MTVHDEFGWSKRQQKRQQKLQSRHAAEPVHSKAPDPLHFSTDAVAPESCIQSETPATSGDPVRGDWYATPSSSLPSTHFSSLRCDASLEALLLNEIFQVRKKYRVLAAGASDQRRGARRLHQRCVECESAPAIADAFVCVSCARCVAMQDCGHFLAGYCGKWFIFGGFSRARSGSRRRWQQVRDAMCRAGVDHLTSG